jgi:predicted O-methyltransferase YrrM
MRDPLEIKTYIDRVFSKENFPYREIRHHAREAGLPSISISSHVGRLLSLLVELSQAKKVLEIGALAGYSSSYLAAKLPKEGHFLTIESNPYHASLCRKNLQLANISCSYRIIEEDAAVALRSLIEKEPSSYDLIFIDADKKNYPLYVNLSLELAKHRSIIICDNLIPKREPLNSPYGEDVNVSAIHECNKFLAKDPRLDTIVLPMTIKGNGLVDAIGISTVNKVTKENTS